MSPVTQRTTSQVTQLLDAFFRAYYARRPVNASFTGIHAHDSALPDWSPSGLVALATEMRSQRVGFAAERMTTAALGGAVVSPLAPRPSPLGVDWARVDADLADAFLELQLAELAGTHFQRGNPSLAAGEAIFSIVSLITRDYAPAAERAPHVERRMSGIRGFLEGALATLRGGQVRPAWVEKAVKECAAGAQLMRVGVPLWATRSGLGDATVARLTKAGDEAASALTGYATAIQEPPAPPDETYAAGPTFLALALRRGHWCRTSTSDLLQQARKQLVQEQGRLKESAHEVHPDGWAGVQQQLAELHPTAAGYLQGFDDCWHACRSTAQAHHLVTWPDYPIRYTELPEWTRDVAPDLYYLFYRSPAPFDTVPIVEYVVSPLPPVTDSAALARHLATYNDSAIKLNHVVHHGAIGHHVQNWYAQRAPSRVGQVAAVDCASRIGFFSGGTMAEGWACYATDLMDEVEFLTPLESVAEQHTRVRLLARAIVDLELHGGLRTLAEGEAFYEREVGMAPAAAKNEVVKNSMFPGTALMYWLGTSAIHDLRAQQRAALGDRFSLRAFHDTLLGFGSIPVLLAADLMRSGS